MGNVALHFRLLLLAGANFSSPYSFCGPIIPSKALQIMEGISLSLFLRAAAAAAHLVSLSARDHDQS